MLEAIAGGLIDCVIFLIVAFFLKSVLLHGIIQGIYRFSVLGEAILIKLWDFYIKTTLGIANKFSGWSDRHKITLVVHFKYAQ